MKTSVEINGYTISIEETEGMISVNAIKDDEVIEEFTIEMEESQGDDFDSEDSEEVKGFGDYDEEEDFEGEEEGQFEDDEEKFEDEDEEDESEEDESEEGKESPALESFQSFINKKRK